MTTLIYNRIHAPKQTVNDYLQQLSNEELASIYGTSFQYKIMLPDLLKKLKLELTRRQLTPQVMHLMWGILLMQLVFFSLGAMFAGLFKKPKLPTLAVTALIMGSYIIYAGSQLNQNLDWLRFITPFRWFAAPSIIYAEAVAYGYSALAIVLSAIFITLCYAMYNRRDITVA